MRKSLIIIIFIILFAFNAYAIAEKTNVAIILHATDKFSFIQSLIKDSIKKAENQITSKLRIKTYDLKKQDIPILIHATEEIINQNNQIIIHGILPYEFSNYQSLINFYMRHSNNIFIFPFSSKKLEDAFSVMKPKNTFMLPEPISEIILFIDRCIIENGYKIGTLTKKFREREKLIQSAYQNWGLLISKSTEKGIKLWEKKTGGGVEPKARSFLKTSYTEDTIKYIKQYPIYYKDIAFIEENTPKEINDILNTYYKKVGKLKVSYSLIKASGVNDCQSPPCKLHCCPKYIEWNHRCLEEIKCK